MSGSFGALPLVPSTALPAEVRNGTSEEQKTYQAALGFERELLSRLLHSMSETANGDQSPGGDDSSDAATNAYREMLPDQLADAVISGGGTGLAENLYRSLRQERS